MRCQSQCPGSSLVCPTLFSFCRNMAGSLDSDLYDGECTLSTSKRGLILPADLYGDNDDTREQGAQQDTTQKATQQKPATTHEVKREEKPTALKESSLPPKPVVELSYSAQVAKQFSAYKQTPAQERQQYQVSPATKSNGHDADHDENGRRAVRPSEMKDEG